MILSELQIALIIFISSILIEIFFMIRQIHYHKQKLRCTDRVPATFEIKNNTLITTYFINNKQYKLKESLKYFDELELQNLDTLTVRYNPYRPKESIIKECVAVKNITSYQTFNTLITIMVFFTLMLAIGLADAL